MSGLKFLLDEVADQARVYDVVEPAYTGGRRRRRMRHALTGVGVFAAVLGTVAVVILPGTAPDGVASPDASGSTSGTTVPPPTRPAAPPAPTSCTVERMPLPAGYPAAAIVWAGDPSGRFHVGRSYGADHNLTMLVWDNGNVSAVAMPGHEQQLNDVSGTGVAVGTSTVGEDSAAWVYQTGTMSRLAGGVAEALGINEQGAIAGNLRPGYEDMTPVVWRSPTGQPEPLPLPDGASAGYAAGIDDDGSVAGGLGHPWPPAERGGLVVWRPDGTTLQLSAADVLVHGQPATELLAVDMRNGWVLAFAGVGDEVDYTRFLWDTTSGALRSLPLDYATAVNAHGWVVGAQGHWPNVGPAALAADGSVVPLPIIPGHESEFAPDVLTISDDGTILAGYEPQGDDGNTTAVIWHCS